MKRYIITLILLITCTFTLTGCRNQTTDSGFKENVEIAWDDVKDDFDQIDQDVENDTSKQDVKALTQTILDGYDKIKEGITQDNQEEAKKIYEAASRLEYIEKNTDQKLSNEEKEIFYHGIVLGLLRCESEWLIQSNIESGDGLVDILIETEDPDAGIIIELKYAQTFQGLSKACENAMRQIRERRYDERLRNEGRNDILAYGIAFCKKKCKVVVERL